MYHKEIMDNGVTVIAEDIPHVRSASIGVWVKSGARDELAETSGYSHFVEHMCFKGTAKRNAKQIAEALDSVGGQIDAFTSKEHTCYFARVLDQHINLAWDVLSDIFLNAIFENEEIEKEIKIVIDEINLYEDTPDEKTNELFVKTLWQGHCLGQSILGESKNINEIKRERLIDFLHRKYTPDKIVVAVAGNIKWNHILKLVENSFGRIRGKSEPETETLPALSPRTVMEERDLEQVHFCFGTRGLHRTHKERYSLYIINAILGGSMSSRLFQEIREKRALAYAIYSYQSSFKEAGLFAVYGGTNPKNFSTIVDVVLEEFRKIKAQRVPDEELRRAKEQLKGNFMLGLESTSNRMSRIARLEMSFNKIFSLDETINSIEMVNQKSIQSVANEIFDNNALTLVYLYPKNGAPLSFDNISI